MSNQIQISAKNLGELAMPSFCPRCFWLKRRLSNKLPFQIFPGIFNQDKLMPMYEVQLNGYALIGENCDYQPVSDLALIYMEPVTHADALNNEDNHREDGFAMGFAASIHKITLDLDIIPPLLARTREINEFSSAPDGSIGCKDCRLLEDLFEVTKV